MTVRQSRLIRRSHGLATPTRSLVVEMGRNPPYREGEKPYANAAFRFRLGTLGLTVWINNTGSRGAYYQWRGWGLSLPRLPLWRMD